MKLTGFLVCLCLLMVGNSYAQQEIMVKSDKELDVDFTQYKTFGWASHVSNQLDEGVYFLNDLVFKADVRDAVKSELEGLGYEFSEQSPDLLVNFRAFDEPVTLQGFEGYGTTYWGTEEVRGPEDTTSYQVEAGTLLISLVDREEGKVVWQGFASGLIDNDQFVKDDRKIKEAVNLIIEDFDQRATEYSMKR